MGTTLAQQEQAEKEEIEVLKKMAVDAIKTAKIYVILKLSLTGLIWILYTILAVTTLLLHISADMTAWILGSGATVGVLVSYMLLDIDHVSFLDKFK